jgi:hypothetical protein
MLTSLASRHCMWRIIMCWLQAFAVEDSTTDEEEAPPPKEASSQESPKSSQDAERRAVLERLQGQENPLAASFKVSLCIS